MELLIIGKYYIIEEQNKGFPFSWDIKEKCVGILLVQIQVMSILA